MSCCCQSQADKPDSVGFCQAAALIRCFWKMRKTEVTATSGFKETKYDTYENEVVLQMIAERVLGICFFPWSLLSKVFVAAV